LTTVAGSPAFRAYLRFRPCAPTEEIEIAKLGGADPVSGLQFEDEGLKKGTNGRMVVHCNLCAYPAEHGWR
jgi:hypothetical protein